MQNTRPSFARFFDMPTAHSRSDLIHPKYRPDIDGLRAVAIVCVLIFHAFPSALKGGFIGVDIFFVISGFLISTIIFASLDQGRFSFIEFYGRRILRIFPALLVVLASCFVFGAFALFADEYLQLSQHLVRGAGFMLNFVLWGESGYFDNVAETKPLLHLWSLAIEEQFYIVWPLVLWGAWRLRFNRLNCLLGLFAVSFGLNVLRSETDTVAAFYSPLTRFWELLIGAALAYWQGRSWPQVAQSHAALAELRSVCGVVLLCTSLLLISPQNVFPGWWALLPTLGAALLISAGAQSWINRVVLAHPLMVWIGLVSFPLYLWHWPLLSFVRVLNSETPSVLVRGIALVLAFILAWLTCSVVEKPLRFGAHKGRKTIALIVAMASLACLAYINEKQRGKLFVPLLGQNEVKHQGDIGHVEFHKYPYQQFALCTPLQLRNEALRWQSSIRCFQSKADQPIDIALIGDSHAEQLFIGLSEAFPNVNFVHYNRNSLPVTTNREFDHIFDYVLNDQHIRTVVISAYWATKLADGPLQAKEQSDLLHTVQKLLAANKKVFITDDVPDFSFDPHKCAYDRWFRSGCSADKALYDAKYAQYFPVISAIIQSEPRVQLIKTVQYFCDQKECSMNRGDQLLYRDTNHLNINGSKYLGQMIARDVLELIR
jgi:peptidoglycan/LPS O-acetylase OafA/YrhL